jgi:glycosyltransferase EpsF
MTHEMKPKRILHVFGQMEIGGAESRTMDLYRAIDKDKYQFDFIVTKPGEHHFFHEIRKMGGRIFYVNPPLSSTPIKYIKDLINLFKKEGPFHAVHAHTSFNEGFILLAANISKVEKRIAHSRSASNLNVNNFTRKIYSKVMQKLILYFGTDLVTCGTEAGEYLFGNKAMNKGKVIVLPNAINLTEYQSLLETKKESKMSLGIPVDKTVIGHVGNFRKVKNHSFLIDIFMNYREKNSESILVFVGNGPEESEIRKKVTSLGIEKDVYFFKKRQDIPRIMNAFDVFILPSLYEGVPGVIVEAQAAALPCLISDSVTKDIDVGTGLLQYVPLNQSPSKWSESIEISLQQKKIEKNVCWKLLFEKGYDVNSSVKKLINIYD